MPSAARADSEYLAGTFCGGSRISVNDGSDDEHPPSSLRHSEVTAVENPPAQAVPELGQRSKDCSEVPTAVARERTGNVLPEKPSGSKSANDSCVFVEEGGAVAVESGSVSGDAEVLAGGAAGDEITASRPQVSSNVGAWFSVRFDPFASVRESFKTDGAYVVGDGDFGEPCSQHVAAPRIALTEEEMSKPSAGEAEVEPADPAEQRDDIHPCPSGSPAAPHGVTVRNALAA